MHSTSGGGAYAKYNLDGQYASFEAIAGYSDLKGVTTAPAEVWFDIHADDKHLWRSPFISAFGQGVECKVNVRGAKQLNISVHCRGSSSNGHTVWVAPRLSKVASAPPKMVRTWPEATPGAESVYLDALAETSVKVGAGELKRGQGIGNGVFEGHRIEHSLTTHAVTEGVAHVAYDLGGKYETFEGAVGIWAIPGRSPKSGAPIVFQIICDGKPLWVSQPHQTLGISEPFRVRVRGIKTLRLEAHCAGNHVDGWAVWLDPRVIPKK